MLPLPGTPLRKWALQPQDLSFLYGDNPQFGVVAVTWVGLLTDSPCDRFKPYNVCRKFLDRLMTEPRQLISEYAALGDKLLRSVFHDTMGTRVSPLFREFSKTPLFREYFSWRRTRDPRTFSYILSFLWFAKKAEYKDDTFIERALAQWIQVEQDNSELPIPKFISQDLRMITRLLGLSVDLNDLIFRHGPGHVAERGIATTVQKNLAVRCHPQLDTFLGLALERDTPYSDLVIPDPLGWDSSAYGMTAPSSAVSRLQFVPKDYKNVRTICMEPTSFMWSQQALMNAFVRGINRSHLGKHGPRAVPVIDISTQETSRTHALWGSEDGFFSTIDMSFASDTVNIRLVCEVFEGLLLQMLLATRTSLVALPNADEDVVTVDKFAPMGSAICFPLQCWLYAIMCYLVNHLRTIGVTMTDYLLGQRSVIRDWVAEPLEGTVVYGDDIILEDSQTLDMMSLLRVLGFRVNSQKSFYGDLAARESCGMFALDGSDVTPVMFKVKGIADDSYESVLGRIALCNTMYARGWMNARNALLRSIPRQFYMFDVPDSPYSSQGCVVYGLESNHHLRRRYNKSLFRWEYRVLRPRYKEEPDIGLELDDKDNPINLYKRERDSRDNAESRYRLSLWYGKPRITEGPHLHPGSERSLTWGRRWTPASR